MPGLESVVRPSQFDPIGGGPQTLIDTVEPNPDPGELIWGKAGRFGDLRPVDKAFLDGNFDVELDPPGAQMISFQIDQGGSQDVELWPDFIKFTVPALAHDEVSLEALDAAKGRIEPLGVENVRFNLTYDPSKQVVDLHG